MQTDHVKAAVTVVWVLSVGTVGVALGVASVAGWTALAVVSVVPPVIMRRLWNAPSPSMSETIRDVLR